jgi:hypothetical protein
MPDKRSAIVLTCIGMGSPRRGQQDPGILEKNLASRIDRFDSENKVLFALECEELAKGLGHLPPAERGGSRSWTNLLHGRCWLCCEKKMRELEDHQLGRGPVGH